MTITHEFRLTDNVAPAGISDGIRVFAPADFPRNCRLLPISAGGAPETRRILKLIRPDVSFVDETGHATDADWLLASGPVFRAEVEAARAGGLRQSVLVLPELATSYYDWWSFPDAMVQRAADGELAVGIHDFEDFLSGLGSFFGQRHAGNYEPALYRYMPSLRTVDPEARVKLDKVLALLGDDASRTDLAAAFGAEPHALWRHWLRGLYNGLEYMDYVTLSPGSVVLNCGVHGGGEIAYFLAALAGEGCVINVDPLGHNYLSNFVRAAITGSSATCHELCVALHDTEGSLDLVVEPGGMAQLIHNPASSLQVETFRTMTVDRIVEELMLDRIDLVKMDIEGAEPRALSGGWNAFNKFRPQFAISIYHAPEHFFNLPLMLSEHLKGYQYFVRNYHFISNETILYAIPEERPVRPRQDRISVSLIPP